MAEQNRRSQINWKPLVLVLLLLCPLLQAKPDTRVNLNFYEGSTEKESGSPTVATSYYLKPLFADSKLHRVRQNREEAKLKEIYNLKKVKLLSRALLNWGASEYRDKSHSLVLNGHEFQLELNRRERENGFRLLVKQVGAGGKINLLDSEINLPGDETAIFGFKDSAGKIYFLSLYREAESKLPPGLLELAPNQVPRLVHRVDPRYPPQAVQQNLEGTVVMDVIVDKKGGISHLEVVKGAHPILDEAARNAVELWKYEPYLVKGKPRPIKFSIVLDFYFD